MLNVNDEIRIPLRELGFTFSRSSGPGGQNVNKVNTKATLRWNVTGSIHLPTEIKARFLKRYRRRVTKEGELVIASQRFRDQGRNVADCLEKLRQLVLSVAIDPKPRRPTQPSRASKQRRLANKQANSRKKQLRKSPRPED